MPETYRCLAPGGVRLIDGSGETRLLSLPPEDLSARLGNRF